MIWIQEFRYGFIVANNQFIHISFACVFLHTLPLLVTIPYLHSQMPLFVSIKHVWSSHHSFLRLFYTCVDRWEYSSFFVRFISMLIHCNHKQRKKEKSGEYQRKNELNKFCFFFVCSFGYFHGKKLEKNKCEEREETPKKKASKQTIWMIRIEIMLVLCVNDDDDQQYNDDDESRTSIL